LINVEFKLGWCLEWTDIHPIPSVLQGGIGGVAVGSRVQGCVLYFGVALSSSHQMWTMQCLMDTGFIARSCNAGVLLLQFAELGVLIVGNVGVGINFSCDSCV